MEQLVCVCKIKGNKKEISIAPVFDKDLQNKKCESKMLIKTLQKQVFQIDFSTLYIKPFYSGDKVSNYSICTNERNNEVVLGSYSEKKIAEHMIHLLGLYQDYPMEVDMLEEIQLCEDLYLQANERLRRARNAFITKEAETL